MKISIAIDNENNLYPGDLCTGKVFLYTEKPIMLKAIKVKLHGTSTIAFKERTLQHPAPISYHSAETILSIELMVFEAKNDGVLLYPGHHEYHFEHGLSPDTLPSFYHAFGKIQYEITAVVSGTRKWLHKRWPFEKKVLKTMIIKTREVMEDAHLPPVSMAESQKGIDLLVTLPRVIFVLDETIRVRAVIHNASHMVIWKVDFFMTWEAFFHGQNRHYRAKTRETEGYYEQVIRDIQLPHGYSHVFDVDLSIHTSYPTIDFWHLKYHHFMVIKIFIKDITDPFVMKIPITVVHQVVTWDSQHQNMIVPDLSTKPMPDLALIDASSSSQIYRSHYENSYVLSQNGPEVL